MTYSEKKVSLAMVEVTSSSASQRNLTTSPNKYARTGFPKYVTVHCESVGSKADAIVIVVSRGTFLCGKAAKYKMVGSSTECVTRQWFR